MLIVPRKTKKPKLMNRKQFKDLMSGKTIIKTRFNRKMLEESLFAKLGTKVTMKLLTGKSMLNINRGSSPHNWWVAPMKDDHNFEWHSGEDYVRPGIRCFIEVYSEGVITYHGNIFFAGSSDEGKPRWSQYILNKKIVDVWNRMTPSMRTQLKKKYADVWSGQIPPR